MRTNPKPATTEETQVKRPAHLTLVDADKIGAVFTQRTEWRERALKAEARLEELERTLPAKDAEGLARVCMSFAAEMLHKQDDIGQRFWTEQAKRLRAYATLRGEEERWASE